MKNNLLFEFNQLHLALFIAKAQHELVIAVPSIHIEYARLLKALAESGKNIKIQVLLDFDELPLRSGMGDLAAIELIRNSGMEVKNVKDLRVSFVLRDGVGILLFLDSRFFTASDRSRINAISMNEELVAEIRDTFTKSELPVQDRYIENNENIKINSLSMVGIKTISDSEWKDLEEKIKENPPIKPDFQRVVTYYSTIMQYAVVSFSGAKLKNSRVKLPENLLPINNTALSKKLETKLEVFDKKTLAAVFKPISDFEVKLTLIREKYLIKTKLRKESILKKKDKQNFLKECQDLNASLSDESVKLLSTFQESINETRLSMITELEGFFIANPKSLLGKGESGNWLTDESYTKEISRSRAEQLVGKIKWPEAHQLLDKLEITVTFSDITLEDLQRNEFIEILVKSKKFTEEEEGKLLEFSKGLKELKNEDDSKKH